MAEYHPDHGPREAALIAGMSSSPTHILDLQLR